MAIETLHLGGPVWRCDAWLGSLYPADARPSAYLQHYASVFNAVEGNSTFYAVPARETFARWRDETGPQFRFCLKLPRTITHERRLCGAERELDAMLGASEPLRERLGPMMIQLPPTFGPRELPALAAFVRRLPPERRFAVEPRHRALLLGPAQRELDALLREHGLDRVIFDATVLHAAVAHDELLRAAQSRKPRLPVHVVATADMPVVRIVVVRDGDAHRECFVHWADRIATWITAGLRPHVFVHTPDDREVPALCRELFGMIAARVAVGTLPEWPGEVGAGQISLFTRS